MTLVNQGAYHRRLDCVGAAGLTHPCQVFGGDALVLNLAISSPPPCFHVFKQLLAEAYLLPSQVKCHFEDEYT